MPIGQAIPNNTAAMRYDAYLGQYVSTFSTFRGAFEYTTGGDVERVRTGNGRQIPAVPFSSIGFDSFYPYSYATTPMGPPMIYGLAQGVIRLFPCPDLNYNVEILHPRESIERRPMEAKQLTPVQNRLWIAAGIFKLEVSSLAQAFAIEFNGNLCPLIKVDAMPMLGTRVGLPTEYMRIANNIFLNPVPDRMFELIWTTESLVVDNKKKMRNWEQDRFSKLDME
jgi:hypothetical protein